MGAGGVDSWASGDGAEGRPRFLLFTGAFAGAAFFAGAFLVGVGGGGGEGDSALRFGAAFLGAPLAGLLLAFGTPPAST